MRYDFGNFFAGTSANWIPCDRPREDPGFYSFSGSTYWDLGDGVVRWSNHWGPNIRTCSWLLNGNTVSLRSNICGFCLYEDFVPNPDKLGGVIYRTRRLHLRKHSRRL